MEYLFIIILLLIYLYFLKLQSSSLKALKQETSYLPVTLNYQYGKEWFIDEKLNEYVDLPQLSANTLIFLASNTCGHCFTALEEFLIKNKHYEVPFIVLVLTNNNEGFIELVERYDPSITFINISVEFYYKLQIYNIPSYLIVDRNSKILELRTTVLSVFKSKLLTN